MKSTIGINIVVLVLAAGFALFSEPIPVVHAKPVPPGAVTCTLTGSYTLDTTTTPDTLLPSVTPSGDCDFSDCNFTFSSRLGDVGDWFAVCQVPLTTTSCNQYTTISVDATVTSFPFTDEPEVIAYCSTNPVGDSQCFTGGNASPKTCPGKEVDCFAGVDQACSASKKLGGGIKGTFVCILNLPEPGADGTVTVTANCKLS